MMQAEGRPTLTPASSGASLCPLWLHPPCWLTCQTHQCWSVCSQTCSLLIPACLLQDCCLLTVLSQEVTFSLSDWLSTTASGSQTRVMLHHPVQEKRLSGCRPQYYGEALRKTSVKTTFTNMGPLPSPCQLRIHWSPNL